MEDVPVASESRTGYGNDRRVFTQPSERSFGMNESNYDNKWCGTNATTDRGPDRYPPREQLPLPSKPPYTAHLGNLPFDATNFDIEEFFQGCEVTNIRIVEDKLERKPKGFGYVEFKSVDGLKKALTLDGTQFRGRNIRISVAEPRESTIASDDKLEKTSLSWRIAKERQESRELNDWTRKGPLADLPQQQRRASERGGFNRGYEAAPEMERDGSRKGSSSFEGDGKIRDFNNWERKGPLSPLPPPAGSPPVRDGGRVRDGQPKERKLSPSWGPGEGREGSRPPREQRERPHQEKQPTPADLDPQWRSKMRPDPAAKTSDIPTPEPSAPSSPAQPPPPAVRPRLNLQKRTVSEVDPATAAAPADSKSSPFGAARPIDTAAREREIEEKMQLQVKLKKEAEEKAREEKRQKEATSKAAAADKATAPIEEDVKVEEDPKENGNEAPAPARSFQILSRVDDENNEIASEHGNPDEPANGEVVQEKATKPREFIREPPKGPKAQQHREWRRKSSTPNTPASPSGPNAKSTEEEGWSTVPTKNPRGRGRGRGGHHDNAGARAVAS